MAVIMVAGNQPRMPKGLLQGVRTMTANIVTEMGYASGLHREALIATGVVLCIYPDHQLKSFTAEQEGGAYKLTYQ